MIPTSIDGTDITGATIDGTDVTEITVDGQTVFGAQTIVDDFETQNLNIWSGSTGAYTIDTSTVKVGTASVRYTSGGGNNRIGTSTGIDATPDTGDSHQVWIRPGNSSNSITTVHYASDSTSGRNNSYEVRLDADNNLFRLILFSGGSFGGVIESVSTSIGSNWYLVEMLHESNGDYTHKLYDTDGTTLKGTLSGNDTTHISGGSFDNTNVQLEAGRGEPDRWDHWIITS